MAAFRLSKLSIKDLENSKNFWPSELPVTIGNIDKIIFWNIFSNKIFPYHSSSGTSQILHYIPKFPRPPPKNKKSSF